MLEEVDVLVDDIETELGQAGTRRYILIIHILDPNFVTWSNVYLSYLVLVQPRP